MNTQVKTKETKKVDRRQFLGLAWLATGLAFTGEVVASLGKFIQPIASGGFGGIIKAGTLEDFPPGSITKNQQGRFFIYRMDNGSFLAMWQRCTHLGCSVPWVEEEDQFHCPCHGSLYNKVGEVQGGPAPRPLDVFPVIIEGGEVYVDTETPLERTRFDPSQTTQA